MDIYLLDNNFNKVEVIDDYISFIWTERFNSLGDFELVIASNASSRSMFVENGLLMIPGSKRVMIVNSVEDGINEEGEATLKVSGNSYESELDTRTVKLPGQMVIWADSKRGTFRDSSPSKFDEMVEGFTTPTHYRIHTSSHSDKNLVLMSVQGGASRPGTSELMRSIAGGLPASYYDFVVVSSSNASALRLASKDFDEPEAIKMAEDHQTAIHILGSGTEGVPRAFIGGSNYPLKKYVLDGLRSAGITADMAGPDLKPSFESLDQQAIHNRAARGGATIVLTPELISNMFTNMSSAAQRQDPSNRTALYNTFVTAVQNAYWEFYNNSVLTLAPREISLEGPPNEVVEELVQYSVIADEIDGRSNPDHLPLVDIMDIYDPGDIPWPGYEIKTKTVTNNLREVIEDICKTYTLGYRMVRCHHCFRMKFSVYSGSDRYENILFSPEMENFSDSRSYRDMKDYRNVCYVTSNLGAVTVYGPDVKEDVSWPERRVMHLDVGDYKYEDAPGYLDDMYTKGWFALLEHNSTFAVDGKVPPGGGYIYDVDYHLGDIVGAQGPDGSIDKLRVTEYIFISDAEGTRSYPTLAKETLVSQGTWLSSEWDIIWPVAPGTWNEA